ncbi:MAG: hypothetical protein KA020_00570 [Planctomycetes bacterium]|nr:hypothetical protein [Planctomycetota bacterium]MCC7066324.1 hypothetical protein [Planctomycetota bacterium]
MLRLVSAIACASALCAQSVVVPNLSANTAATTVLNNPLRNSGNPRTYMMGINASELAAIPAGSLIVGVSLRAGLTTTNAAVWPLSDVTFNDYEILIGDALPTTSWTSTFLNNFSGTPLLARDGVMVVQAGAFTNTNPSAPVPNAWGTFFFDFQVPFPYSGGDLGIQFSHPGSNDPTSIFFEQVPSNTAVHGQAISTTGFQATTATSLNYAFCVARIHYGYGSNGACPGTNGLTPVLVDSGDVTGGGTIHLAVGNAPANGVAVYVWGLGRATIPAGNGCDLLTPPMATTLALLDANGRFDLQLNVPPGVAAMFNTQVAVLDPANPAGFTLSNGVEPTAF